MTAVDVLAAAHRSTLGVEIPATLAYDVGGRWTGVCLRVGTRAVNAGTLTTWSRSYGWATTLEERERAVFDPPGKVHLLRRKDLQGFNGYDKKIIGYQIDRLIAAGEWLLEIYEHLLDDGKFWVAVERPVGVGTQATIAKEIARGLEREWRAGLLPSRGAGSLHQPGRGGTGDPTAYYPPPLVGARPEWAEPDKHGRPVRMLPNEHMGKRGTRHYVHVCRRDDEQAAFDVAAYAWTHEDA